METKPGKQEIEYTKKFEDDFSELHVNDDWTVESLYDKALEVKDNSDNNFMELGSKLDDLQNTIELINENQDELKDKILSEIKKINQKQEKILSAIETLYALITNN